MQSNDEMIGKQLPGGIVIQSLIGSGGQATVYLGHQESVNRPVAVKFLNTMDPLAQSRFRSEGESLARVKSPYAVQVFNGNEYEGRPFLVMEYIEGASLNRLIESANAQDSYLPLAKVRQYLSQIAQGLTDAHSLEPPILHRDVKPANVLIEASTDRAVLVDFGLAKVLRGETVPSTMAGAEPGTLEYMSPEQVSGITERIDQRTDIWAMGVTMYEMLTGERPFGGPGKTGVMAITNSILRDKPASVRLKRPDLDPEIDLVMSKVLAKEPRSRYQTAKEFADDACRVLAKTNDAPWWDGPVLALRKGWHWLTSHIPGPRLMVEIAILLAALVLIAMQADGCKPDILPTPSPGTPTTPPTMVIVPNPTTPVPETKPTTPVPEKDPTTPVVEKVPTTPVPPPDTETPVSPTVTITPTPAPTNTPPDVIYPIQTHTEGPGESRFQAVNISALSTSGNQLHVYGTVSLPTKVWNCEYWNIEWCGDDTLGACGITDLTDKRVNWYYVDGVNARTDADSGLLTSWPMDKPPNAIVWLRLTAKDCDKGRERYYAKFDLRQLGLPLTAAPCPN